MQNNNDLPIVKVTFMGMHFSFEFKVLYTSPIQIEIISNEFLIPTIISIIRIINVLTRVRSPIEVPT